MKSRFLRKLDKDTKDAVGIIIKRSVVRKYNMYLSRNTHISNTSCLRNKYSFTRNYYTVTLMGTQKVATHETGPNRSDMTGVSGSNRSPDQIVFRLIINLHVYRCENKHTNERKTWIVGPVGDLNTCHYQIQTTFEKNMHFNSLHVYLQPDLTRSTHSYTEYNHSDVIRLLRLNHSQL